MENQPSVEAFAAWSRDDQAASGWVMLDVAHPAHAYLLGDDRTIVARGVPSVIDRRFIGHFLVIDEAVTVQHGWHGAATPERVAPYGAASFLPLIQRVHGTVWIIVSAVPDDLRQQVTRRVIWRRMAPHDPGAWSIDGGAHWFPVTEPVVAVDMPASTVPHDAEAEWGIPDGVTRATALRRWGWLLYRGDWGNPETAHDFHHALQVSIAQECCPGALLFSQPIADLALRLIGDVSDPVMRLEVERDAAGNVCALAAIRASGRRNRWPLLWTVPAEETP